MHLFFHIWILSLCVLIVLYGNKGWPRPRFTKRRGCLLKVKKKSSNLASVPHGSVMKCLTRNPGIFVIQESWVRAALNLLGFFVGVSLQSPSPVLAKPREYMNKLSCRRDMAEILLKAANNTIQSINQ